MLGADLDGMKKLENIIMKYKYILRILIIKLDLEEWIFLLQNMTQHIGTYQNDAIHVNENNTRLHVINRTEYNDGTTKPYFSIGVNNKDTGNSWYINFRTKEKVIQLSKYDASTKTWDYPWSFS